MSLSFFLVIGGILILPVGVMQALASYYEDDQEENHQPNNDTTKSL